MATRTIIQGLEAFKIAGALRRPGLGELDPITVILQDHGEGRGTLIVTCYASAWTCYWGAMGNSNTKLRDFMSGVSADYIAGCLIRGRELTNQRRKRLEHAYLEDICRAIKASINMEAARG